MNANTFVDPFPYSMSVPLNTPQGFILPTSSIPYELGEVLSRSFVSLFGGCANSLETHLPYLNTWNNHFTAFKNTYLPLPQDKSKEQTGVMGKMEFDNLKQGQVYTEHHLNEHTASLTP
jgi:hypothetical protein